MPSHTEDAGLFWLHFWIMSGCHDPATLQHPHYITCSSSCIVHHLILSIILYYIVENFCFVLQNGQYPESGLCHYLYTYYILYVHLMLNCPLTLFSWLVFDKPIKSFTKIKKGLHGSPFIFVGEIRHIQAR